MQNLSTNQERPRGRETRLQNAEAPAESRAHTAITPPGLIPVNVRDRPDITQALKAASLKTALQGMEPFSMREIVEQVFDPWLKKSDNRKHAQLRLRTLLPFPGSDWRHRAVRIATRNGSELPGRIVFRSKFFPPPVTRLPLLP